MSIRRAGTCAKIAVWNTHMRVGAWRSLVARTVRVGEVPGSNPGAPISTHSHQSVARVGIKPPQPRRLIGADGLEVLVDEDVVRPVDADVVDLVLAVAQLHNTVDDAPRVGGQRSFRRLICFRCADDRPRSLSVVRWDLTDLL